MKLFLELDCLDCGPHRVRQWAVAKQQFEHLLRPAEQTVASKLKRQLNGMTNIRQVCKLILFVSLMINEN